MPFLLYERDSRDRLSLAHEVSLAGTNGPFARHVRGLPSKGSGGPVGWHVPEARLLEHLDVPPDEVQDHALIIDLKPKAKNLVSLFRIRDVWGFSYGDWTPIALRLETQYSDFGTAAPERFKQTFTPPVGPPEHVHEFLYLQGGTHEGRWTWGLVGRVNGALLWPDALDFLFNAIRSPASIGAGAPSTIPQRLP